MPALPSVPKVLRIAMNFALSEDLHATVRFFELYTGTPPLASDLLALAAALATSFDSHTKVKMSGDSELTSISLTDLSSSTGAVAEDTVAITGTNAGHIVPGGAAFLESRHIARRFRGGHSRIYWPLGCAEDLNDEQTWKATFVAATGTAITTNATDMRAAVWSGGGSLSPVAVSFYEGFTVHTGVTGRARNVSTVRTTPVVDPVISTTYQPGVASQRRRLLRLA